MTTSVQPMLDLRALPGTRETTVYRGGGQFPVLTLTQDGACVAVLRGGAGHLGLAGRVEIVRSLDGGQTWTPPAIVADSERDDRNPALGTSPDGTLLLAYHRMNCYDEQGRYVPDRFAGRYGDAIEVVTTRSTDGGLTWEAPTPLAIPDLSYGSPFGKIVCLADGTALMAVYRRDAAHGSSTQGYESWLVRSTDDGRSWGAPARIATGYNETGLLALPDGTVLAALRGDAPGDHLAVARSTDGGGAWSAPRQLTGPRQHPADLVLLADGSVLLTYGNRNPPYRVEGRVSRDGGATWLDIVLTFSGHLYGYNVSAPRPTDLGYPTTVIRRAGGSSGQGVTLYYYNPALLVSGDARLRPGGAFYDHRDYLTNAVTWREDELLAALNSRQ